MALVNTQSVAELKDLAGKRIGPSEWRQVSQEDVDAFARVSGDHQWIHVDVERARKESPYKATIAHGNLTLAMIDGFRGQLVKAEGYKLAVNYGWNKVRFLAPVLTGSRIRASVEVLSVDDVGKGWWQVINQFTVEVEGSDKPACVADSVVRYQV